MPEKNAELCHCRTIHLDRIARARQGALEDKEITGLTQLFKAMADPTRMKILLALDQGEMCVCDLASYLGISESAVSHQLRLLRQLHLVANRREKAVLYYRLVDCHVNRLISLALEHVRE